MEPNGVLCVNERGMINGQIKVIKPHPEFRLFFTMDPRNGEISRAMRNRGIEIFLIDAVPHEEDNIRILNSIGIPGTHLGKLFC